MTTKKKGITRPRPDSEVTRSLYFRFAPPPYPRDKTASNNSPPPGLRGWTCPRGCPGGMVTGKIEPCIRSMNDLAKARDFPESASVSQ